MKKIALSLWIVIMLATAACNDNSKENDQEDAATKGAVMNSGPETEAGMAKDALKDSAEAGSDSTVRRDIDAPSTPH